MLEKPSDVETRYFLQKEIEQRAQLRDKLKREAEALRKDREIAKSTGASDQEVPDRLRRLGFDADTAKVIDLLPLVHIAWADGTIQHRERATIMHIIDERGFGPGHAATRFIESLLEHRPADAFMEESLDALKALLDDKGKSGVEIVDMCVKVADVAGGYFGLGGGISEQERKLIADVAAHLGSKAITQFHKLLS